MHYLTATPHSPRHTQNNQTSPDTLHSSFQMYFDFSGHDVICMTSPIPLFTSFLLNKSLTQLPVHELLELLAEASPNIARF